MADEQSNGGAVISPDSSVNASVVNVPDGWVLLYDENGKEAIIREADRAEWEHKHGLITEQYDIPQAHARWDAIYKAVGPTVAQAMQEFADLGFVRDEMYVALNTCMGEMVDSYRWLFKCVGALLPTETQVADMARLKQSGELAQVKSTIRQQYEPLIAKLPSASLDAHLAQLASDAGARTQA